MPGAERSGEIKAAVRAGRSAALRKIWLCADDYGISPSVNMAIRYLIALRRINATSVMVVAPGFYRTEAVTLRDCTAGHAAVGLHMTLTAPFRPLTEGFRPLKDGAFLPLGALLSRALLRRLDGAALMCEIASQVRMFTHTFGRPPDFVDGHQHVQLFPQVREALLDVMKELAPGAWVRQCGRAGALLGRLGDRKGLLLDWLSNDFRARAEARGVRTNPAFAGTYTFKADADFAALFPRFLDGLPDGSVVMCHPGFVDAELERLDPLTTLREKEYEFFADDSFPKQLAAQGVTLA
jgi:predicted glycoside hydrolase/deacetylase ChbG (UPF0249 family)